jgi:hypothetical protein
LQVTAAAGSGAETSANPYLITTKLTDLLFTITDAFGEMPCNRIVRSFFLSM